MVNVVTKDKKLKECYDWWESLTEERQLEIMTSYYPDEVKEDTDIDKMFGDMPSDEQMWIYIRVKELTHEQEILITEANEEKRLMEEIEKEEVTNGKLHSNLLGKANR